MEVTRQRRVTLLMWVVLFAILCAAIAVGNSDGAQAQGTVPDPRWQAMFRRPIDIPAPPDNPLTPEKIALGAKLFADPRLSGKGDLACASCHQPARAFSDGRRRARVRSAPPLRRNTPSLWNLAWGKSFSWDGRAPTLEAQVEIPIAAADEMAGSWPQIVHRLEADRELAAQFATAFPQEPAVSQATIAKALAAYVRSLVSPLARFDRWIEGDARALNPAEARGFALFTGKAACVLCHVGWRFTDDRFHDIGLAGTDRGQGDGPDALAGLIAFKTPGLREALHTAPYMHDGSRATLAAVLGHYGGGFVARRSLAAHMNRNLRLSVQEKSDLIQFLQTLSSEAGSPRPQTRRK
jgi:cytochrome c peroxidase